MVPPPPHPVVSCSSQTPFPESPSPEYLFMFLGLWESKVSFTMAPEASKFSVYSLFAPEISQNSWNVLEMSLKTNIFHKLSVGSHGHCWFYQHFQQFP